MSPEVEYSLQASLIMVLLSNPAVRILLGTMFNIGNWQVTFLAAGIYFGIVLYMMRAAKQHKASQATAEALAAEAAKTKELGIVY